MEFNFEKQIKCVCGIIFEISDFKKHFTECQKFKECFSDFDSQLSKFIKSNSKPKEQLLIIKFVFEQYIKILDKKIKGNFVEISKAFKESFINSFQEENNINGINHEQIIYNKNKNKNISQYDVRFSLHNHDN